HSAVAPAHAQSHRRDQRRCRARVSLLVYGGTRETDEQGGISKWSLRPPFINRLFPAETRLKEGAHAHDSGQDRWESSLAAGWWRPVGALPAVSRGRRFDVKRVSGLQPFGHVMRSNVVC